MRGGDWIATAESGRSSVPPPQAASFVRFATTVAHALLANGGRTGQNWAASYTTRPLVVRNSHPLAIRTNGKIVAWLAHMGWDEFVPYSVMCLLSAAAYGLACWLGCLL